MYVCLCLNPHNVMIISMIFSFLLLLSICCLFVGAFSHGLNLLTRSGSEAENISQEKECPLMFVCKVSMLFSYSRDASIFVLCLQTGGSETENTSQKSNVKAKSWWVHCLPGETVKLKIYQGKRMLAQVFQYQFNINNKVLKYRFFIEI